MILLIGLGALVSTLCGGLFALKYKDKLHLILGFSAGAVIGVAFFDLMPEALGVGINWGIATITSVIALGFVIFMLLDRFVSPHSHNEEDCHDDCHNENHHKGALGAGSLSFHSLLDGLAIGFAFQVSSAVGVVVAIAVLAHDFSDGINTVSFILRSGGKVKSAFKWLLVDAIAPVVGIILTQFFTINNNVLGIILALFCGFFLYIGASDLLPESHHQHGTYWTTISTVLGILVLYVAISLAGL